ncbi:1142_t:CDS:1, partial [Scutellospora calospora]
FGEFIKKCSSLDVVICSISFEYKDIKFLAIIASSKSCRLI